MRYFPSARITGYGQFAPFEQMSAEDFQAVIDTCFYGVVYTTRAAVPVMHRQRNGHIFQVSSAGGRLAVPGNTPYHAAKWAVGGFSDALAIGSHLSESRFARWSREAFGPTGCAEQDRTCRTFCRTMKPRSVRY